MPDRQYDELLGGRE